MDDPSRLENRVVTESFDPNRTAEELLALAYAAIGLINPDNAELSDVKSNNYFKQLQEI